MHTPLSITSLEILRSCLTESEKENAHVHVCSFSAGDLHLRRRPPVREGVLGQVQVGEVGAAASQQGPEQLAGKQRDK